MNRLPLAALGIFLLSGTAGAQPSKYLSKPDSWFAGDQAKQVAANILSFLSDLGG